jgi:hypothetical protein
MKKATIIYPQDATFTVSVPELASALIATTLGYCWEATNPDSGDLTITRLNKSGTRLRSSMVGDIYIVQDRYFVVNSTGFAEVSEAQAIIIQRIPANDRIMGWDWMKERYSQIENPIRIIN